MLWDLPGEPSHHAPMDCRIEESPPDIGAQHRYHGEDAGNEEVGLDVDWKP